MVYTANEKLELLSAANSSLALVDFQPSMIRSVASGSKTIIRTAAYCAAKAASILGIPVVPLQIAKDRYARWEITREHYEQIRKGLLP